MVEGKETLSQFISLVKELKDCISNGKTGDYQAAKMFEMSDFVEKISKEITESEYKDEMEKQLLSLCNTSLNEVQVISNELLTGFLLLKISDDSTRNAVSQFISRFGDTRFSTVCHSLIEKRQIFMTLSSLTNNDCTDDIITAFLLQIWTKHLKNDSEEENKAAQLFDSMLQSKNSFDILARISKFDAITEWKTTIHLIYSRVYSKLKPYDSNFWSWFINSKEFFQKIVQENDDVSQMIFEFMIDSSTNSKFDNDKSEWTNSDSYLSIFDIVLILHNFLTLECTFNKTKIFMDEQKIGSNKQYWTDVGNHYFDFRLKSLSFSLDKNSSVRYSS